MPSAIPVAAPSSPTATHEPRENPTALAHPRRFPSPSPSPSFGRDADLELRPGLHARAESHRVGDAAILGAVLGGVALLALALAVVAAVVYRARRRRRLQRAEPGTGRARSARGREDVERTPGETAQAGNPYDDDRARGAAAMGIQTPGAFRKMSSSNASSPSPSSSVLAISESLVRSREQGSSPATAEEVVTVAAQEGKPLRGCLQNCSQPAHPADPAAAASPSVRAVAESTTTFASALRPPPHARPHPARAITSAPADRAHRHAELARQIKALEAQMRALQSGSSSASTTSVTTTTSATASTSAASATTAASDDTSASASASATSSSSSNKKSKASSSSKRRKKAALKKEMAALRDEVAELRRQLEEERLVMLQSVEEEPPPYEGSG